MLREYMFNDADNMIDLAKDIQSNVYWGGHFYLGSDNHQEANWKDFWDVVTVARSVKGAVGVVIHSGGTVNFIYKIGGDE